MSTPTAASTPAAGRRSGTSTATWLWWADLLLLGIGLTYAMANAAWARLDPHRIWGREVTAASVALFAAAAVVAAVMAVVRAVRPDRPHRRLRWAVLLWAATAVAWVVVPTAALSAERAEGVRHRAQSEVTVIETSGDRLRRTGSPYLDPEAIDHALLLPGVGVRAYVAYGPTMALFGLPRSLFGSHAWTDARVWFLLVAAMVAAAAVRMARLSAEGSLRVAQALTVVPPAALTIATGGDDLPVLALCLLGLALGHRRRWGWAAVVFGLAVSMKYLALPAAVVAAWWAVHDPDARPEAARRHGWGVLAGVAAVPTLALLPALWRDPPAVWENLLRYPLGLARRASTAASPLPGRLIAQHLPGGHVLAVGLLALGAAAVLVWLWRRPPTDCAAAAAGAAVALAVATLLAPSPRFGYLLHPIVLGAWWAALRVFPARPIEHA